jgi:hypothetical protein
MNGVIMHLSGPLLGSSGYISFNKLTKLLRKCKKVRRRKKAIKLI